MSPRRSGWDFAQVSTAFLSDPEFQKLRGLAKSDAHFLAAVGLWAIATAQAWRSDSEDVAQVLTSYPGFAKGPDYLRAADLIREGDSLAGFAKWTDGVRAEREIWARRAAMNANPKLTQAVRTRDGDSCRYCGQLVNWQDRRSPAGGTYDHVVPIDQGGTEAIDNLVVACRKCNFHKGARTPEQAAMTLRQAGAGINPVSTGSAQINPVSTEVVVVVGVEDSPKNSPKPPQVGASRRGNGTNPRATGDNPRRVEQAVKAGLLRAYHEIAPDAHAMPGAKEREDDDWTGGPA